jgi:hypothetical protein
MQQLKKFKIDEAKVSESSKDSEMNGVKDLDGFKIDVKRVREIL